MRPFVVKFEQLSHGSHDFEFEIDKLLFKTNEDVLDAKFKVDLDLYKTGNMMDMKFYFTGSFMLPCDRCNEALWVDIEDESKLVVKYGQTHHEDLDELIVLEDHEHELDLEQYFYETLSLFIPARRVHEEKDCNPDIIAKLGKSDDDSEGETDPRWEKLKEI